MAKILKTNILPYLKSKTYLKGKIDELLSGKSPNKHAVNADAYGLGTTGVYGHVKTVNGLTQASHQDGLALAAYQGKILKDLVDGKANTKHTHTKSEITDFPTTMTPSNHAHGALANGGTLNSDITSVNKIAVTDDSNNLKTIAKLPLDKVTHQDISGKIDTAGTGLAKSGTKLNHSNSVTAQTTSALKKIKFDNTGHITGVDNVAKTDITALGIPGQDTVYTHPASHATSMITEASAFASIGSAANATQHAVNEKINAAIASLKSSADNLAQQYYKNSLRIKIGRSSDGAGEDGTRIQLNEGSGDGIYAKIYCDMPGFALSGKDVVLVINTVPYIHTTDSTGKTDKRTINLGKGNYIITAFMRGYDGVYPASDQKILQVL
ncbi:MAG: hypothetical protein J6M91_03880 [Methanobrevibacter sp.]|nr:hypothetical protein [Methanobrevibacter sp.]